ncbi:MAG: hypothetical protein KKA84_06610 [Bacteroidetes bacterium]|nr:hypothetical protein [Bacteroidota bacterium]
MNENHELILKYLAGLIDDEESFKKRLEADENFAAEFKKLSAGMDKVDSFGKVELNDNYFNSMIPKVRSSMDKKRSFIGRRSFIYSVSTAMATVIIFLMFNINFSSRMHSDEVFTELMEDYNSEELLSVIEEDDYFSMFYLSDNLSENYKSEVSLGVEEYLVFDDQSSLLSLYRDEYIDQLSDEEMELILQKLDNKNFF